MLNEDYARFTDAYDIEVYIENTDGFAGEGDLLGKFGLEVRDQATFILSRRRWEQLIGIFNNNNTDLISEQIDILDDNSTEILKLSTKIGDIFNRITLAEQQLTLKNMNLASYVSSLEDVDMAEAVLKYNSEEIAYKAALQSTGNIMKTSLLDYIR